MALLRYKYKSILPVLMQKGFKFGEKKEDRETAAHTYQTSAFPVAAAGKETAHYSWCGNFHHRHCFSNCGGGVVHWSVPTAAPAGNQSKWYRI
jgi:hypothetical protein